MSSQQTTEYRFHETKKSSRRNSYNLGESSATKPSTFKCKLSQILASISCHLLVLDLCMSYSFTTIVIAALLDSTDDLKLDADQASWLGSIAFICQPLGSIMSGFIVEFFGRKWSMILVNMPFLLGWILYSVSNSVVMLYVTNVILGIGIGFMEAPIMTYIAETCQPELRGILASMIGVTVQVSFFVVYLLGNVTGWRTAAAISAALPIITALFVTQTPMWLLSRGRTKDAERALCWLRGWVTPDVVKEEFNQLVQYNSNTKTSTIIQLKTINPSPLSNLEREETNNINEDHNEYRNSIHKDDNDESHCSLEILKELLKPPTLRPLMLVIPYFFLYQLGGMASIRPYMVHVFREFGLDDVAEWITVGSAVIGIIGGICLVTTIDWLGKRFLSLVSFLGNGVACLLLAVYSIVAIHPGSKDVENSVTWVPLTLIVIFSFFSSVMFEVPWTMLSEIFPFRTRGIASGFSAAMCYVFLFIASKTYLDLELNLELYGTFLLFAVINFIGFVFVYYRMPRMEGKTLEEIEEYFSAFGLGIHTVYVARATLMVNPSHPSSKSGSNLKPSLKR
ncbi:hypothetical protein L9F63_004773, partial [Diploptera punctata]